MLRYRFALGLAFSLVGATALAAPPTTGPAPLPATTVPAPEAGVAPMPPGGAHALTADDLHAFLDGLVPYALHRGDMAGATVAVVKDGQLIFAQGYGYADLKTKKPVVADETLFRPGSVSKLFTWTSVMQLVEQGKLDLDKDVNTYLDFKIPDKFGAPITLRNIMTHSAGFEESVTDTFVEKPEQQYPLRDYLIKRMPERIFPPGKVVAYSNFATTIAGYIVQRVSGEKFEDYVANHIFKPLGMEHASFNQPLPPALLKNMAVGYKQASDPTPVPFEVVQASPAGALSATATDMAKFMIAHLHDGAGLLKPETAKAMHSRNFSFAPGLLNGFDLGFYQENRNGHRIIGHAGDTVAFHSDLHLILDADTGMFLSFNSLGKDGEAQEVRWALFRAFLDRYFPFTPPDEKTVADPSKDNAKVVGYYGASRRKDSALRLLFGLGQTQVAALPDGTITVEAFKDFSGAVKKWRNVGPLLYREVGGQTHLQFVETKDGDIDFFQSDDFLPVEELQRVHGLEQLNLLKLFGIGTIAVCALALIVWFGGWIVRRRFGRTLEMSGAQAQLRLGARLGALLYVLTIAGWVGLITAISVNEFLLFNGGLNMWMALLYGLGVLAILGGVAMAANGVLRLMNGPGGWLARAGDLVLGLAGLYGIWAIIDFGLANFQLNI
ncbi:MAG TPA: serine hydrolase domain-containing protein [Rhizomicrobium sp.]|nr:serine hydrolase domain-containing protein [Rhizomicrobium sp.]